MGHHRVLTFISFVAATVLVTGCSMTTTAINQPAQGAAIQGVVHGGQQPIVGAHVYLFAANTTGYGQPSVSLLKAASTGFSDSIGAYVPSQAGGTFSLTGDYTCTAGQEVYIYSVGGDPEPGTSNPNAGLMAILGTCPGGTLAAQVPFVTVNEVSTVSAAYAMAGFATDALHVSAPNTTLAQRGLTNAFANAAQLANVQYGQALTTTPNGNGTVPQQTIDSLANGLAGCINSDPTTSTTCSTLFGYVKSAGASGTTATDTATEAIYIAHNPAVHAADVVGLASSQPPFQPTLITPPNDLTIGINYTGTGINHPEGIAIDAQGNAWITNSNGNSVTAISPAGVPLAGSPYTAGSIVNPQAVAIDSVGSVWVTNFSSNTVTKLASTGLTGVNTTAGSQVQKPGGLAIDASNTAWMTNLGGSGYPALIDFASPTSYTTFADVSGGLDMLGGVAIDFTGHEWVTSQGGYVLEATAGTAGAPIGAGSLFAPTGVAIDSGGNAWVADAAQAVVTKIGPGGGTITQFSGGGLDGSIGIALDGAQNVWLANNSGVQGNYADGLSAFNSAGTALSTATGYSGGGLNFPYDVAVDGSGNVWATNPDGPLNNNIVGSVTELIGAGIPVVTPIAASLASPYTTAASKP